MAQLCRLLGFTWAFCTTLRIAIYVIWQSYLVQNAAEQLNPESNNSRFLAEKQFWH